MRMTDYEKLIQRPGRADLVKQVRGKIDELGIDYLYLQFVSVTGRIVGKGIPAEHWENDRQRRFQLVYGATVNLFIEPARRVHRLWSRGAGAGRHSRSGNVHAAALGQAGGADVLHAASATARKRTIPAPI